MNRPVVVSVTKESLGFSAAHFLTLPGHVCERLHGHNYRIGVRVEGPVDPGTGFVVDFAVVKQAVRGLIDPMDHRLLVPTANPNLIVREDGDRLRLEYQTPDWLVVQKRHACLLPVTHTTAEALAEYLADRLLNALVAEGVRDVRRIVMEVEESPGQAASVERSSGGGRS
jgi:6-pyruvoyltetrahydropterin/6-carboxytetrahydropterin synthase